MSQISTANDFVRLDQPDQVPDQDAQQQFGLHQNPSDCTGSARNYDNELKEHKLMIANLEVFLGGEQGNTAFCFPI
jgi:hypothetical protein